MGCPVVAARLPVTEEVGGDLPFWFDLVIATASATLWTSLWPATRPAVRRVRSGLRATRWDRTATATLEVLRSLTA